VPELPLARTPPRTLGGMEPYGGRERKPSRSKEWVPHGTDGKDGISSVSALLFSFLTLDISRRLSYNQGQEIISRFFPDKEKTDDLHDGF
jgi:hypothetical protein